MERGRERADIDRVLTSCGFLHLRSTSGVTRLCNRTRVHTAHVAVYRRTFSLFIILISSLQRMELSQIPEILFVLSADQIFFCQLGTAKTHNRGEMSHDSMQVHICMSKN